MSSSTDRTAFFGVDPRSLAAFRMGLGLLVVADVALRLPDLRSFYTDYGVVDRISVVQQFWPLHEHAFSLHLAAGGSLWIGLLFALQALAGVALVLGWRSRQAALVAWMLVMGVQLRNLYIGEGYDALIRMLLLWSVFAPTGTVWSLDARDRPKSEPTPLRDVGSLAVVGQIVLVYLITGSAKYGEAVWRSGEALSLQLQTDFFVTTVGTWLSGLPALCMALTLATLWGELLWPLAFLVPVARGPVRTVAVLGMAALTIGFWLGLDVDLFPAAAAVGLLALLPAWFWDRVEPRLERFGARLARLVERAPVGEAPVLGAASGGLQVVAAGLFTWVLMWNIGLAADPGYRGPTWGARVGQTLFLQQNWRMFARPAQRSGWVAVNGVTRGGQPVDLMSAGGRAPGPVPPESIAPGPGGRPLLPSAIYANNRWRTLLRRIAYQELDGAPLAYGRYLCREWNGDHEGAQQLEVFTVVFHHRPVPSDPGTPYEAQLIWEHGCFR